MKCNFNGLNKTKMENIEELLREAFRAGMNKGSHQSYFDAPLDETEYIDSIKDKLKLTLTDVVSTFICDYCKDKGSIAYWHKTGMGIKPCKCRKTN